MLYAQCAWNDELISGHTGSGGVLTGILENNLLLFFSAPFTFNKAQVEKWESILSWVAYLGLTQVRMGIWSVYNSSSYYYFYLLLKRILGQMYIWKAQVMADRWCVYSPLLNTCWDLGSSTSITAMSRLSPQEPISRVGIGARHASLFHSNTCICIDRTSVPCICTFLDLYLYLLRILSVDRRGQSTFQAERRRCKVSSFTVKIPTIHLGPARLGRVNDDNCGGKS